MISRYAGFLLGIILFLPNVHAMDAPEEVNTLHPVITLYPVTVRIWERLGRVGRGYISVETPAHYMSLRLNPYLEGKKVQTLTKNFEKTWIMLSFRTTILVKLTFCT